jgi:hypothetical protein
MKDQIPGFRLTPRLLLGLAIMGIGLLYTLENLGVLDASVYLRMWPVLLILFGLSKLWRPCAGETPLTAWAWIIGGSLLLASYQEWLRSAQVWPLIALLLGATIVGRALSGPRPGGGALPADDDYVKTFVLMSGLKRAVSAREFRGGEGMAIMGGVELDLRSATIGREDAVIDVFVMWGGIDIFVPPGWEVVNRGFAFMGGFEDKSVRPANPQGRLVVTGVAIMGGVEISNGDSH